MWLEPGLKEVVYTAGDIPTPVAELRDFIESTTQETGIKFDYNKASLSSDNWMLDVMTNQTYVDRIRKSLETKDMFDSTMDDFHDYGIGEPDWDLFDRTE